LIKNDHAGACKARNTGVEAAQYDWIAMLDSDDAYLPNRLEKQLTAAQANPEVILWGTYLKQINAEGKPIGFIKFGPTSVEAFNSIDRTEHAFVLLTSTALFRKETFLKSGGFDSRLTAAQDTELWDRMLQHGPAIIIPEPLVLYRYHGQSISAKRFFDQRVYMEFVKERLLAQRNGKTLELEAFIAEYKSASRLKRLYRNTRILGRYHYRNVGVFVSEGRRFTAFISLLASLVLTPKFATARISNRFFPKHFA
jgi:glycosyltransferase involved in cell wall biosynthesis